MRRLLLRALPFALAVSAAAQPSPVSSAVPVRLLGGPGNWVLQRGGQPYFIKGVAGGGDGVGLDQVAADGGNSIRTWGADQLPEALNQARKRGLTVLVGIWLSHKGDGVDYSDPAQVAAQQETALAVVRQYKDDPAVLAWGLGNEMEADGNDTPELWKAVDALAVKVKELDPNHPTVTVVAELGGDKLDHIRAFAPDIDILGVNSYAGASSLAQRIAHGGWTKPFIVTEFGPPGPWESEKTSWGAALELTSTQKAAVYRRSYTNAVLGASGSCLGSYAFLWGYKNEGTPTWFGMLMPDTRETLGAVDVLTELWTGSPPQRAAPKISGFDFNFIRRTVAAGDPLKACVKTDSGSAVPTWRLFNDADGAPDLLASSPARGGLCLSIPAPAEPGAYRLFVELRDGGRGATANGPFQVGQ